MADKNTIKNWFRTGLKPNQAQFWALFDSYFHKDEKIPITAIGDIETILNGKADAEALTNHDIDAVAHAELFLGKQNKSEKGIAEGYVPLNEIAKIASQYLNIVNDLVSGGATNLASAETVKTLKAQIDGINLLLTSNDVNLDTVQEIVTAIKTVQTSLSTILVNDLTTGGTAKALSAEMGKTLKALIDSSSNFTTQEILSGGNYNNLEITADLLVFKNENAQAILNGVWGKKDFHILNLSTLYEVRINHNSSSISGNGQPIMLPTASGNMGVKGTARILQTAGYGYFVADTWGSKYRPEFKGLTEEEIVTVNENSIAGSKKIVELKTFRDAQTIAMTKADLNTAYPLALRGFEVICPILNVSYLKVNNNTNDWKSISNTSVV